MSKQENNLIIWADAVRGTTGGKLLWVIAAFMRAGIEVNISGVNINQCPVVQIPKGYGDLALSVLNSNIGVMEVGEGSPDIAWSDLNDDHWLFDKNKDKFSVGAKDLMKEFWESFDKRQREADEPDPIDEEDVVTPEPVVAEEIVGQVISQVPELPAQEQGPEDHVPTEELEEDEDDWDLDDDEDIEEDQPPEQQAVKDDMAYTIAEDVLAHEVIEFPSKDDKPTYKIKMYNVPSENVLKIGMAPTPKNPDTHCIVYVMFKKETKYRYTPVPISHFNDILSQGVLKEQGRQEASVGSTFHHLIKGPADEGTYKCQRLGDDNLWKAVPTKAERAKSLKDKSKTATK
jgi:hypothetical protein